MGISIFAFATLVLPSVTFASALNRELSVGMSGTDVSVLQTFLAKDATIYPQGLVTGYFGFLTKSAVANFQSANNIPSVGRVGPQTLPVLNFQIENGIGNNRIAPTISSVSVNTSRNGATVNWSTNEFAKGVVYYSTSPLMTVEHEHSVDVSGSVAMTDAASRTSQNVIISGLQQNTVYYYMIYTTDTDGNVSVTWPSYFQTNN